AGALGFEAMNVRRRMTAAANLARRAEMIDMVMRGDDRIEILDLDPDFRHRLLECGDAFGRVHPGIDKRPCAVTVEQINVDDCRPHRQRQKDLVDTRMNLNYFRRHRLLSAAGFTSPGSPCAPPPSFVATSHRINPREC